MPSHPKHSGKSRNRPRPENQMISLTRSSLRPSVIPRVYTRVVNATVATSSNIGGVISTIITCEPNAFSDWSSLSVIFDEFRVIGGEARFFCDQQNSITVQSAPVIAVYDNDDASAALASLAQAMDYTNQLQFASVWDNNRFPVLKFTRPVTQTASASPWASTGTPAAYPCSVKIYGTGLTANTQYFTCNYRLVVQFRGTT